MAIGREIFRTAVSIIPTGGFVVLGNSSMDGLLFVAGATKAETV